MSLLPRQLIALFFVSTVVCAGCDRKDPDDLPEWTPSDHDNQTNPQPGQVDTNNPRPGMPSLAKYGITDVVLTTWKQSCVPCHGVIGRGDGPRGAALRPRDLTDPGWQRVAIDSEIAHTIKKGRGRMAGFPDLPDETVEGLVHLVRLLNADPNARQAPPEEGPNEPEEKEQPAAAPPGKSEPEAP